MVNATPVAERGAFTSLVAENQAQGWRQCHNMPVSFVDASSTRRLFLPDCRRYQCWMHGERARRRELQHLRHGAFHLRRRGDPLYFVTINFDPDVWRGTDQEQQVRAWPELLNRFLRSYREKAKRQGQESDLQYWLVIERKRDETIHAHLLTNWLPSPTPVPTEKYPGRKSDDWLSLSADKQSLRLHIVEVSDTNADVYRVTNYMVKHLGNAGLLPFHAVRRSELYRQIRQGRKLEINTEATPERRQSKPAIPIFIKTSPFQPSLALSCRISTGLFTVSTQPQQQTKPTNLWALRPSKKSCQKKMRQATTNSKSNVSQWSDVLSSAWTTLLDDHY